MSKDRLTGPGGFIDISQSTNVVMFMSPLTAGGLDVSTTEQGNLTINQEGKIKKFVNEIGETTFSGDEAVRRGQKVLYVTERAVFRRSSKYPVLELIEIAPGIDLQKDVLDQLEFEPVISPNLKLMDRRIFKDRKMNAATEIFGSFRDRFSYHAQDNVMFLDLFGINLNTEDDLIWFFGCLREKLDEIKKEHGKMNMVINYDGLNLSGSLEDKYWQMAQAIADDFYLSVRRFAGGAFHHAQLGKKLDTLDTDKLFRDFDSNGNGMVDATELREGFKKEFNLRVTQKQIDQIFSDQQTIQKDRFASIVMELLEGAGKT
jgi:propionate CoA-transferase